MKKFLTLFLVCLLVMLPVFVLGGCKNTQDPTPDEPDVPGDPTSPEDPDTPTDPEDPADPEEPVVNTISIVENGAPEYRIIISDFAKDPVKKQAQALRKGIETVTGVKPDFDTDWTDQDDNANIKEILVGKTNRTESANVINSLGGKEYAIVVDGNKIIIAGATDDLLTLAVSHFLATYVGYNSAEDYTASSTVSIPENLNLYQSFDATQNVALYVTNDDLSYYSDLYDALATEIESVTLFGMVDDVNTIFDASQYGLVVVAGVEQMVAEAATAIDNYMNAGGRILTLGGPAFETTVYEFEGDLYERDEYLAAVVNSLDDDNKQLLIDTASSTIANKFFRSTDAAGNKYTLKVGDYDLPGSSRQLFHEVSNLSNWDNVIYRFDTTYQVANSGMTAICFWAKAMDDHTGSIYVEITDAKGSRWITSPVISEEWQYKILIPTDFTWWKDSTAPTTDTPDFNGLKQITIGFAKSGQAISSGHHSYCIAEISLVSSPTVAESGYLALDSVAPMYELYPITNGAELVTSANQVFVSARDYVLSEELISCHPGRQGLGYGNARASRFIPLIEVKDEKGLHSGYAAWMHIFSSTDTTINGNREGSMLACFSSVSEEFYNADGIAAVVETAKAMTHNVFLVEGGTNEFIYVEEDTDKITAGLSFVNLSGNTIDGLTVAVELWDGNKLLDTISSEDIPVNKARNNISQISATYEVSKGQPDRAVAMLMLDGEVIDKIEQDIKFWAPKENPSFIYIEDGYFKKDGEIVNFFGVNYMPSYGIAEPNSTYFENYVARAAYDPTVVANDLDRIVEIGMNSVSVFVHYQFGINNNNMLDLIQMCEERGLYVNLSIRDVCYPLKNYDEASTERLITYQHFHENDNVYAYDIVWEPRIGAYDDSRYIGRKRYDADWLEWINVQYGSVAAAEKAWGITLTKTAEGAPYVSDDILNSTDTRYLKVTSAYYRFLDDEIAKEMIDGVLHMQSVAPNQLITFRMSMAGSGYRTSTSKPSTHNFDFAYLASTVSYMEPEGYALAANDAAALQIPIANAYARYVQPESPIVWKEFGKHVWSRQDDCNFYPDNALLQASADYYAYTLEYCLNSYTSGMYAWYFAGGFRINEDSDYGIINPDGSDRPVTALLREYAPLFINQGERPEAEVLIEVERDNMVGGMYGIYDQAKEAARKAYDEGKFFEFIDANQDEPYTYPYADEVYTEAVGDAKTDSGIYPLRYVNGMIKDIEIVKEGGKTYANIMVCNTKQSIWRTGTVSIISYDSSDIAVDYTINTEMGYLENQVFKIEISGTGNLALRFEIEGVEFGNLYTTTVK